MNYISKDKYQLLRLRYQRPANYNNTEKVIIKYAIPALKVHGEKASLDKMSLDIRTYICANGLYNLQQNRSHR